MNSLIRPSRLDVCFGAKYPGISHLQPCYHLIVLDKVYSDVDMSGDTRAMIILVTQCLHTLSNFPSIAFINLYGSQINSRYLFR